MVYRVLVDALDFQKHVLSVVRQINAEHDAELVHLALHASIPPKPFFSGLDTLPQGGGCLPAFLEILGALSGITPPPPVGVGQEWVGIFCGKYL